MAPGFVLQQSLTGFSLVSLPVLSMNIFVKAPHGLNSPLDSNHFSWVINHDNQSRKPLFFFSLSNGFCDCTIPGAERETHYSFDPILLSQCCCVDDVDSWWFCLTGLVCGLPLQRAVFPRAGPGEGRNCFFSRVAFKNTSAYPCNTSIRRSCAFHWNLLLFLTGACDRIIFLLTSFISF